MQNPSCLALLTEEVVLFQVYQSLSTLSFSETGVFR